MEHDGGDDAKIHATASGMASHSDRANLGELRN
jgi:hypothetical protein